MVQGFRSGRLRFRVPSDEVKSENIVFHVSSAESDLKILCLAVGSSNYKTIFEMAEVVRRR